MTAKPLSAEDEADLRTPGFDLSPGDAAAVWATLDAARAETAAVVRERDALAEFARTVIHDVCWDQSDPDGGDIQDEAERLGLIVPTAYDPAIHGDNIEADPGDRIYVFAPWLRAAALGVGKQDGEKEKGNG